MEVTQEMVRSLFHYDEESGLFRSLTGRSKGKIVGYRHSHGYVQISIHGKAHYAHRLAWLYVFGCFPSGLLDHINGKKDFNAISNLREVDFHLNGQNQREARADSSSGALGVSPKNGRWRAAIKAFGRSIHIGTFDCIDDAAAAYIESKRELHPGCTI